MDDRQFEIERYRLLRSYIEHEDGLINQRMLWSLITNGGLLATFGTLMTATGLPSVAAFLAGLVVAVVGALVTLASLVGVRAAKAAIIEIIARHGEHPMIRDGLLPPLIGGGHPETGNRAEFYDRLLYAVLALWGLCGLLSLVRLAAEV